MEHNSEIIIETHQDMLAAVVATLFTPTEVGATSITYDKETIFYLAAALDECFKKWYNVSLDMEIETE